ncbi:F-box/kelch-repeat protein SKIP20-like [Eucalyptus grandis]|uniref:F-box/kelch-repeat protein SKIP20-like n=1 Tax=Eucalyptus grandis TaxID=71139 RepID=UPI00192EBFA5|nr:F-box/kelch-repeat protein SKIP20-like [Eucalyptus grandis]
MWPTENSRSSMALTTQNSNPIIVPCGHKLVGPPRYSITVFDLEIGAWDLLDPVLDYPDELPLFCHLASCDGELVALGGWDPATYEPVANVFAYDFAARGGVAMPRQASFFAVGAHGRRIYVAGGHNKGKNALRSTWAYDMGRGKWAELPLMSHSRDKCEGRSFWVVSEYGMKDQGWFEGSAEVYDFRTRLVAAGGEGVAAGAMPELTCRHGEGRAAIRLGWVEPGGLGQDVLGRAGEADPVAG